METLVVAIVTTLAALGSAVFAGVSLRMLARQTRHLSDQVKLQADQTMALGKQTELQAGQYEILAAATELQFNLDVMVRLQEVLLAVADDDASHNEIWGDSPENRRPQMAGDAVLDVVAMALKACDRLPHFASNVEDWKSYTEYVMATSPSLRSRALSNPEWWPEITPYAENAISSCSEPMTPAEEDQSSKENESAVDIDSAMAKTTEI